MYVYIHVYTLCLVTQSCRILCDPMDYSPSSSVHGNSPGRNTGVGCHALLQGILPTQGLNPGLPHCRRILYCLSHQRSPCMYVHIMYSNQIRSVAQSCPTLCDPMNRSTPGLPVYHQLLEFTETHVHRVSDAIQPSHPLSSSSPPAPNPSQHQSLFQ